MEIEKPQENLKREDFEPKLDSLREKYGGNKKIPKEFEIPFYIALSVYPELVDVEIKTIKKSFGLTLQAQPDPNFIFRTKENRTYRMNINTDKSEANGVLFADLPFNAQVGILAHELAHIADYHSKTNLEMMKFAIMFLCIKARKGIERRTDQEVIKRGFGWQLYDWSDYAMYRSTSPRRHKFYKHGYYLNPEEILEEMQSYPALYKIN